jgi:hypothetical protein
MLLRRQSSPKWKYRFGAISMKTPIPIFVEMDKLVLKFTQSYIGTQITKTILKRKKVRGGHTSQSTTYYKTTVIETVWHWHKDCYKDQWSETGSPVINSYINVQLIFNKADEIIQQRN